MNTNSKLEKIFAAGHLAVTSEVGPPRGSDVEKVKEKAEMLRGVVDGVNVTDNQTAVVRLSSWSACIILKQMGLNPILQMVTRDRNRLAMQSDILGVWAHGVDTMLCLSGDHPKFGDHPTASNVYDLDSIQLIQNGPQNAGRRQVPGRGRHRQSPQDVHRRGRQPLCRSL